MKKVLAVFCMGITALVMSCGEDSPTGGGGPAETDLIGKWAFSTMHSVGTVHISFPPIMDTTMNIDSTSTFAGNDDWLDLKSDKSYQLSVVDPTMGTNDETGTWTLNGSALTMISSGTPADTTTVTVSVSGTSGTFSMVESSTETDPSGATITYNVTATISATKQ